MMSERDVKYLLHLTDEAYQVNAVPTVLRWITNQRPVRDGSHEHTPHEDEHAPDGGGLFDDEPVQYPEENLFDEERNKTWDEETIRAIKVNRPDKEVQDRYATRNPIKLIVSISRLELERHGDRLIYRDGDPALVRDPELLGRSKITPDFVIRNPNHNGRDVDFHIMQIVHDGEFIDTNGNTTPLSYSLLLTDDKVPSDGE